MKRKTHLLTARNKAACLLILLMIVTQFIWGQSSLKLTNGAQIKVVGEANMVIHNTSWENNGQFTAGNGTVSFTGTTTDSIKGTHPTTFHKVVVNKTGGGVALGQATQVADTLQFIAGNLNLNGFDLTLESPHGVLVGESETNRIVGPTGGEVIKVLVLNAPNAVNPGNMGATITSSANLGTTILRRGHVAQVLPGNNSIERYYQIIPSNNSGLNASVNLTYFDAELNGLNEVNLESWHFDGTNWLNYSPDVSDASANFVTVTRDVLDEITLGEGALKLTAKAFLQGAYAGGLMSDNLRSAGLLPLTEPYTALGYTHVGGGGEATTSTVLNVSGNDGIMDWVFLELRDKNDSSVVIRTQSALLQRDGDIVGMDGVSGLRFAGLPQDEYYLTLKHRNHLGVRLPNALTVALIETSHDFTSGLSQAWDNPAITTNDAMIDLGGGVYGLFRGDANSNDVINIVDFLLAKNNSTPNQSSVYTPGDFNLDGNINVVDFLIGKAQSTPNKVAHD